jgi:hypothetical protein
MDPIEVMLRHIEELIEIHEDPARSAFLVRAHPDATTILREVRASLEAARSALLGKELK